MEGLAFSSARWGESWASVMFAAEGLSGVWE